MVEDSRACCSRCPQSLANGECSARGEKVALIISGSAVRNNFHSLLSILLVRAWRSARQFLAALRNNLSCHRVL